MSGTFQINETVICSAEVRTYLGVLTDPATSMKITITDPAGVVLVNDVAMTKDTGTGLYHYDFNPSPTASRGSYNIKYTATDGVRITIQRDSFILE